MGSLAGASDPSSRYYRTVKGDQVSEYRASKAALNMLMIQYGKAPHGFKTWGADPGPNTTGSTGLTDEQRQKAHDMGVPTPDVGGAIIAGVVKGESNVDVGRVVGKDGEVGQW